MDGSTKEHKLSPVQTLRDMNYLIYHDAGDSVFCDVVATIGPGDAMASCDADKQCETANVHHIYNYDTNNGFGKRRVVRQICTDERPFICEICNGTFMTRVDLNRHTIIHTDERPYICETCSKRFLRASNLRRHALIHVVESQFVCEICSSAFPNGKRLRRHKLFHFGARPYVCKICSKGFAKISHLRAHVILHSGLKPFVCGTCNKSFSQKSHLHVHERIHSGEKPFACETCGKGFNRTSNLRKHERIHVRKSLLLPRTSNDFELQEATLCKIDDSIEKNVRTYDRTFICEICTKGFTTASYLRAHERIHRGDIEFVCRTCNKIFTKASDLRRHELIHTGERRFICGLCSKRYSDCSSLRRHMRCHSKDLSADMFSQLCSQQVEEVALRKSMTALQDTGSVSCAEREQLTIQRL